MQEKGEKRQRTGSSREAILEDFGVADAAGGRKFWTVWSGGLEGSGAQGVHNDAELVGDGLRPWSFFARGGGLGGGFEACELRGDGDGVGGWYSERRQRMSSEASSARRSALRVTIWARICSVVKR